LRTAPNPVECRGQFGTVIAEQLTNARVVEVDSGHPHRRNRMGSSYPVNHLVVRPRQLLEPFQILEAGAYGLLAEPVTVDGRDSRREWALDDSAHGDSLDTGGPHRHVGVGDRRIADRVEVDAVVTHHGWHL